MIETTLKLVKNNIILVQITQLRLDCLVYWDDLERFGFHCHVPNLDTQVVSGNKIASIGAELDVRNGIHNVGEEAVVACIYSVEA